MSKREKTAECGKIYIKLKKEKGLKKKTAD